MTECSMVCTSFDNKSNNQLKALDAKTFIILRCAGDKLLSPLGGIGRHKGLKIPRLKSRAGSSPAAGTNRPKIIFSEICIVFA